MHRIKRLKIEGANQLDEMNHGVQKKHPPEFFRHGIHRKKHTRSKVEGPQHEPDHLGVILGKLTHHGTKEAYPEGEQNKLPHNEPHPRNIVDSHPKPKGIAEGHKAKKHYEVNQALHKHTGQDRINGLHLTVIKEPPVRFKGRHGPVYDVVKKEPRYNSRHDKNGIVDTGKGFSCMEPKENPKNPDKRSWL